MNEVLHANIFFIIASVASVIFAIITCLILYQIYKIVRIIRSILERVETASEVVAKDVSDMHSFVANGGGLFTKILNIIISAVGEQRSRRKRSQED